MQEESARAIAHLQESLRWEHASIVQLLSHAYRVGDLQTLHTLEGISRQEMRHYKWLAEMIVKLGGKPTVERAEVYLEPASPLIWLQRDVQLIEDAIARYRLGLDLTRNEALVRLYTRMIDDEEDQRRKLLGLIDYWREQPEPQPPVEIDHQDGHSSDAQTRGFLEFAINHEYEVILQYLQHSFLLEDQKASRDLEEVAVEEMRHLGWLSEKLVDHGGCPYWQAKRLELTDDPVEMLELDQAREIEVEADYQEITAAMADPEIRQLFDRIGAHENYHTGVLGELIARLKAARQSQLDHLPLFPGPAVLEVPAPEAPAPAPPRPSPTVGSLFGQPQH